jgi:uncharacterized protein YraI
VHHKNIFLLISTILLCTGCSGNLATGNISTATPGFVTAILPSLPAPQAGQETQTPTPPIPTPETNISPVEGMTTTQVNVRAAPSTASKSLGMISPFVKVQVTGKDASGSWYQVIYADSTIGKGWLRAEYAQVNATAEIPLVEIAAGSGTAVSGLVIQKVNVRSGPGTEFESLGILNPNDIVFITGKDAGGKWIQIEFADSPDGKGWVTAEFLQTGNIENVPLLGNATTVPATPMMAATRPNANVMSAMVDNDSMQAPLASTFFSPTGSRTLQVNGDVSAPDGDMEDWIKFTTDSEVVEIKLTCSSNSLQVELWKDDSPLEDSVLSCGDKSFITVASSSSYFLRLSQPSVNEPRYTSYSLSVEDIH